LGVFHAENFWSLSDGHDSSSCAFPPSSVGGFNGDIDH
jgi:hypothetical protein